MRRFLFASVLTFMLSCISVVAWCNDCARCHRGVELYPAGSILPCPSCGEYVSELRESVYRGCTAGGLEMPRYCPTCGQPFVGNGKLVMKVVLPDLWASNCGSCHGGRS